MKYFNNKLSHHGVKGQEWGVRNGPPYPIEDKVLKKGTRINSVSSRYIDSEAYRKNGKPIYTYRAKVGSEQEQKDYKELNVHDIKTPKDVRVAYDVFNHAMEAAYAQKSTREYLKRMSEKYDAMVDDNNQGVYNQAHDPIIVFKGDLFLKSIESKSKYLTYDEIIKNSDEVREELNKKGINMKL